MSFKNPRVPRTGRPRHRGIRLAVVLALMGTALVGCGDDDSATDDTNAATDSASDSATDDPAGEVLEVSGVNYAFGGLPATVGVGATVSFTNDVEDEVHELVLQKFPDGEDRSLEELLTLPEAELEAIFADMPDLVSIAGPGQPGMNVLGDGVLTEPGRYAAFCAIQQGADPEEYFAAAETSAGPVVLPDAGPPHFTLGMVGEITVEG